MFMFCVADNLDESCRATCHVNIFYLFQGTPSFQLTFIQMNLDLQQGDKVSLFSFINCLLRAIPEIDGGGVTGRKPIKIWGEGGGNVF